VFWDDALPGFGLKVTPRGKLKVTPRGKKVFIVLYRTGGAGSALRKYTIGPYGRVTLHAARAEAQKILAARLEGRDPAAEKQHKRKKPLPTRSRTWWRPTSASTSPSAARRARSSGCSP